MERLIPHLSDASEMARMVGHDNSSSPNPHNNQSKNGLILEVHNGRPSAILTPIGRWQLIVPEEVNWAFVIQTVIKKFNLHLVGTGAKMDWGYEAQYYAQEGASQREEVEYISYPDAKDIWARFKDSLSRKEEQLRHVLESLQYHLKKES